MAMNIVKTPHSLHFLVCTNRRENGDKSCGDSGIADQVFDQLKGRLKELKASIRVSRTGCLGPCAQGPNVMCYPEGIWLQNVGLEDMDSLVDLAKGLKGDETPKSSA